MSVPEVVLYSDGSFGGDEWRTNLNYSWVGSDWNDSISSFQCVSFDPADIVDPVTIDTADGLDWFGTGYTGTVTVSRAAALAFNDEVGNYTSYGVNPQYP